MATPENPQLDCSHTESLQLSCSRCGSVWTFEAWVIIDASKRPDLLESFRTNELNRSRCPSCGRTELRDGPVLVCNALPDLPLLFSPSEDSTTEEAAEQAQILLSMFENRRGATWNRESLVGRFRAVERAELLHMLGADQAAVEWLAAQEGTDVATYVWEMAEEIERLRRQGSETYEQIHETDPGTVEQLGLAMAFGRYIEADSHSCRQIIEEYPELLTDRGDALFENIPDELWQQLDNQGRASIRAHRDLLRLCRALGVERAFAIVEVFSAEEHRAVVAEMARLATAQAEAYASPALLEDMIRGWRSFAGRRQVISQPLIAAAALTQLAATCTAAHASTGDPHYLEEERPH